MLHLSRSASETQTTLNYILLARSSRVSSPFLILSKPSSEMKPPRMHDDHSPSLPANGVPVDCCLTDPGKTYPRAGTSTKDRDLHTIPKQITE